MKNPAEAPLCFPRQAVIEAADAAQQMARQRLRPPYLLNRLRRASAWTLFIIPYAFLYLPLITVAAFSFNDSKIPSLPYVGFTTHWYEALVYDEKIIAALLRSLTVAGGTVAIAPEHSKRHAGTYVLFGQHLPLRPRILIPEVASRDKP